MGVINGVDNQAIGGIVNRMTTTSPYEQALVSVAPYHLSDTRPHREIGPRHIYVMRQLASFPKSYAASGLYAYQWPSHPAWQIKDGDRIYGAFTEQDARAELERIAAERWAA